MVDLLTLVAVGASVAAGWVIGGTVFGGFLLGFVGGLTGGVLLAGVLFGSLADGALGFLLTLILVFGGATALAAGGYHLGTRLQQLRGTAGPWVTADQVGGATLAGLAALGGMWLAGSVLVNGPPGVVSNAIHGSAILRSVDQVLPPAPTAFIRAGRHLGGDADSRVRGQPTLFAGFEPTAPSPVTLPDDDEVESAARAAREATLQVVAEGCPAGSFGSGFVVADGLVVTNAHVIAGVDEPEVVDGDETHPATPVLFDARLDLAVLRAPAVTAAPLELLAGTVERGETAAAIGFPDPDRTFDAEPAAVLGDLDARGRDLLDRELVERQIYQLRVDARPGGSGGPLVRADGTVVGVMFGRAGLQPMVGYALTTPAVRAHVDAALQRTDPVDTGPCLP